VGWDWREIVSRLAMLFMAGLCIAAGLWLIHAGNVIFPWSGSHYDFGSRSTAHYLDKAGFALMGVAAIFIGTAFTPPRKD
jgi:hypothetical protein